MEYDVFCAYAPMRVDMLSGYFAFHSDQVEPRLEDQGKDRKRRRRNYPFADTLLETWPETTWAKRQSS